MIRVTITGERFPIPRQVVLAGDHGREEIIATIDDALEKEQALQFDLIDGSSLYLPAVTLMHGVSDIQVEELPCHAG